MNKIKIKDGTVYIPKLKVSKNEKYYVSRYVYFDEEGKRKYGISKRCKTANEAYENAQYKLRNKQKDIINGNVNLKLSKMTLGELAVEYINAVKNNKITDVYTTKSTLVSNVNSLIFGDKCNTKYKYTDDYLVNKQLRKFTKEDINDWLSHLEVLHSKYKKVRNGNANQGISYSTYSKFRGTIKLLLSYAETIKVLEDLNQIYALEREFNRHCQTHKKAKGTFNENKEFTFIKEEQFKMMLDDGLFFKEGTFPDDNNMKAFDKEYGYKFFHALQEYVILCVLFYGALRTAEIRPLRIKDFTLFPWGSQKIDFHDYLTEEEIEQFGNQTIKFDMYKIDINKGMSDKVLPEDREEYKSGKNMHLKTKYSNRIVFIEGDSYFAVEEYIERLKAKYRKKGIKEEEIEEQLMFPSLKTWEVISDHGFAGITERAVKRLKDKKKFKESFKNLEEYENWNFTKHNFRTSRICIMLDKRQPLQNVCDYVGHSDIEVIKKYYDVRNKEDKFKSNFASISSDAFEVQEQYKLAIAVALGRNENIEKEGA